MSKDDVKYLLGKGYKVERYKRLASNKKEEFLLKARHNESLTHLFTVYDTADYLESKGIKVETYATKKPDLVFKIGKENYAIEVETGAVLSKVSRMKEKLEMLKDYDKWFFIVTDKTKVTKYREYGETIDPRYLRRQLDKMLGLQKSQSA